MAEATTPLLSDRYRLEAELGTGGMSTVHRAHDSILDRQVAIKLLHRDICNQPEQLERFNREARAVAQLSHAHIVTVIDAGEDAGRPFIVFEYVEGETLKQRIRRLGRLSVGEAVAYAVEIGRALAAAHAQKLIHRDVKPQNVLIDEEGRAKVTDFGIARSLDSAGLTVTGRVLGTTDYVSPEQALGQDVDGRSDIYSLGVVLYEMLTGEVPFTADTPVGVAMKHVREAVPDVQHRRPEISASLAAIVERATAKELANRYASATELVEDLEDALAVEAARAGTTTGEATTVLESIGEGRARRLLLSMPSRPSRSGWGVLGLAAAGLAVAAIVGLVGGGEDKGPVGESYRASALRLPGSAARDYDPQGDSSEHPDEVGLAIDGDPATTAWTSETYSNRDFGNKAGVGLYFDLGRPVSAKAVRVRSAVGDWSLEVRGAPGPDVPAGLERWRLLGEQSGLATRASIELRTGARRFRYYLLWVTNLAPAERGFRVEISDVELFG